MSFYTHFHRRGNAIFLRWVNDEGERKNTVVKDFRPTLYLETNEETKYTTLEGKYLKPVGTDGIREAQQFIEQYKDVSGFNVHGNTNWDYSYVNERWKRDIEYSEDNIRCVYIDIETEVEHLEFPDPAKVRERINLITLFDGKAYKTFALERPAELKIDHDFPVDINIMHSEEALLKAFVHYWESDYPDVVTGWNSEGFDIPYIVRRIQYVLGEAFAKRLSPVGKLREKIYEGQFNYEIKGVEALDYMLLFKKYIPGERDFRLDAVCSDYIGSQKLDNPGNTFQEFYRDHWNDFVDYNIRDVHLLYMLEQKLKLLSLTYSIAYLVKMNFSDVFGTVKPWDIFIQNYLYKENRFVSSSFSPGTADRSIMGGFVMDPIPGRYEHVVSFDANSLYPSIIRSWNISPETLVEEWELPTELMPYYDRIQIEELLKGDDNLTALLKEHNLSMTANGQFFRRDRQGIMPLITGNVYDGRVDAKNLMKRKKKELQDVQKRIKELEAQL